ncbi:MAG: hypothetical protein K2W85_15125 [Phycisphaerales bacterium]|nr:hypothetical protein [Phycisphaerales bacterium]
MLFPSRRTVALIATNVLCFTASALAVDRGWWAEPGAVKTNPVRSTPVATRSLDLAGSLDAGRVRTVSIDVQDARATLQLTVPIEGAPITFVLTPHPIRTGNFRLIEHRETGLVDVAPPESATYRSTAALPAGAGGGELRAVSAAISFVESSSAPGVRAMILLEDGSAWYVQPAREIDPAADADTHIVYPADAVQPTDTQCGGAIERSVLAERVARAGSFAPRGPQCLRRCEIAVDSDFEYFTSLGSSSAAVVSDVESLMNAVRLIYERDIRTTIVIPTQIVRATNVVYTNAPTIGDRLDTFATEWRTTQAGVARDLAHLMSGVTVQGGIIGLAFDGNGICDLDGGYAVSVARFSSNFQLRAALIAHEIGHNFGANHCNGDFDCSIMCATINGCTSNFVRFSSGSIPVMLDAANTSPCLDTVNGASTPASPGAVTDIVLTIQNAPIDIDVLANDFDPNCEALTIGNFSATTTNGGTISRVVGAGPGGRDLLRYTPGPTFSGTDSFLYLARDTSGRSTNGTVRVEVVVSILPSTPPGNTAPGLNLDVYRLGGAGSGQLPDFGPLTPYASAQVADINYPATSTNVVNSGRSTSVAARFTGTLSIPVGGTWTFFTESSSGSALFIDSIPVVFNDFPQSMTERSGTITLAPGNYAFRVEYAHGVVFSSGGLIVRFQGPDDSGIAKQVIPASAFTNLTAEYFVPPDAPSVVPSFAALTPFFSAPITAVDFPAPLGLTTLAIRPFDFGASFTGWFICPADGVYTFSTESGDGSLLFLNNQLIVNNNGVHDMLERTGRVGLRAGAYPIRIDYFQVGGNSGIIARVDGPAGTGLTRRVLDGSLIARSPRCASDFNFDGGVTITDIFDFLNAWFAGTMSADFDGMGGLTVQDVFSFLNAWFAGC